MMLGDRRSHGNIMEGLVQSYIGAQSQYWGIVHTVAVRQKMLGKNRAGPEAHSKLFLFLDLPPAFGRSPFPVTLMSLSHYKFPSHSHLDTSFAAAWLGGGRGGRGGRGNFQNFQNLSTVKRAPTWISFDC